MPDSNERNPYEDDVKQIREIAEQALGLRFDELVESGVQANAVGLRTEHLMASRRLDSRTYFVQDTRFGIGRPSGTFEGGDDELTRTARDVMDRLRIPVEEIADEDVMKEQGQVAEVDRAKGAVRLEDVTEGKRLARLRRRIEGLPVWSSHLLLGLTSQRQIGFLQLHWPEIPTTVLEEARRLSTLVHEGWRPPEQPGARVESVEAGIIHSPAVGFLMDIYPAIRLVYEPTDPSHGRKLMLHLDRHGNPVPVPRQLELPPEGNKSPRQAPTGIERGRLERTRTQFRSLLIANPNYFGNLEGSPFTPEVVVKQDSQFEELTCIGYEPQLRRLEGVVYVKREVGYGGDVCSAGTPEFVRFYLSFDNGATWQDQGMASFTAYDIPGSKPLEYDVTLRIDPPTRFCFFENLPRVRAILSWNNPPPPNTPGFMPIWGNVQEAHIQIDTRKFFVFGDLLKEAELELPAKLLPVINMDQQLPAAKPKALSAIERHALYRGHEVPTHRYLYPEVHHLVATPQATTLVAGTGAPDLFGQMEGIDLSALIKALLATDGDTSFEELCCLGLDPNDDTLVGTLTMKRSAGYSGGLCSAGSLEYVAFWVDFGSGWTYQGTTSVRVHDIQAVPVPDGLQYAVVLPIDLAGHRQPCQQGPKTARVRAILSWQVPPPPGNPDFVPVWGNREETLIHIKPGPIVDGQVPFISRVGNVVESQIDGVGLAHGVSPFGGRIDIAGHISNSTSGLLYRVMRKPHLAPDSLYAPVVNEPGGLPLTINTWNLVDGWQQSSVTVHANAQGYYPFEDYSSSHSVEFELVGQWYSTIAEDNQAFDLRMDLSVDGNPAHDVHSNVVTVLVDNTRPVAELSIDLGTGVQCADFDAGVTFTGHFTATDLHFGSFSFSIEPSGPPNDPPHGVLPAPASGTSVLLGGAIADPGVSSGSYTLNTGFDPGPPARGPMDPCGYALILDVWDRTIVDSGARNNTARASVGFCLRGEHP